MYIFCAGAPSWYSQPCLFPTSSPARRPAAQPNPGEAKLPEIPSTWLHASFAAHASFMGLAVKDPKPEDVAEHSLRLHQINNDSAANNARRNNTVPLPYHCRGVTALLSIVSAMMLTGASVQSQQVSCSSSRVPFLELSEEERKR